MPGAGAVVLLNQANIAHQIKRGLAGHWPLARDGAVDLFDYSGNVLNLTNNNSVTRAAGPSANLPDAAAFVAASTQYFSASVPAGWLAGQNSFSVAGWFYRDGAQTSDPLIIGQYNFGGDERAWGLVYFGTSNRVSFRTSTDGLANTAASMPIDSAADVTWYFAHGYYDAPAGKIGIQVDAGTPVETAFTGGIFSTDDPIAIGVYLSSGSPTIPFNGRMSQWLIRRGGVFTQPEIDWLFNDGDGRALV